MPIPLTPSRDSRLVPYASIWRQGTPVEFLALLLFPTTRYPTPITRYGRYRQYTESARDRHLWARTSDDTPAGYGRVFPLGVGVLPVRVMGRLVLFNASAPTLKRAGGG